MASLTLFLLTSKFFGELSLLRANVSPGSKFLVIKIPLSWINNLCLIFGRFRVFFVLIFLVSLLIDVMA